MISPTPLRVRGRSFIALALAPEAPLQDWLAALDTQMGRAPGFFDGKPVVIDLSGIALNEPGLRALLGELRRRGVRVMGLEGIARGQSGDRGTDLPPVLAGGRPGAEIEIAAADGRASAAALPAPEPDAEPNSLLLDKSVRSGQSIHFLGGDVTVLGSVASGAEIIAGGSIHIYGSLRGRAFAGLSGDTQARIFCHRMEAELLAIAGAYATADSVSDTLRGRPAQAWFDGQGLAVSSLG